MVARSEELTHPTVPDKFVQLLIVLRVVLDLGQSLHLADLQVCALFARRTVPLGAGLPYLCNELCLAVLVLRIEQLELLSELLLVRDRLSDGVLLGDDLHRLLLPNLEGLSDRVGRLHELHGPVDHLDPDLVLVLLLCPLNLSIEVLANLGQRLDGLLLDELAL